MLSVSDRAGQQRAADLFVVEYAKSLLGARLSPVLALEQVLVLGCEMTNGTKRFK